MADAYRAGWTARLNDEPIERNPHPPQSNDALRWAAGWRDRDEHETDRDEALESIGWFG